MFLILLLLPVISADFFNKGEKLKYNEYHPTSKFIKELNQIYQPAVDKVTKLQNGDPIVTAKVAEILQTSDPFLTLAKYIYDGADENSRTPRDQQDLDAEYDFIIVGAGSAGCVLANRLSEVGDWNILLIEAGGDELFYMDIPLLAFNLQQSEIDWQYQTEPSEKYCNGLKNNSCLWPRGKVLGGTSVLNALFYTRGSHHDYDNWSNLGNPGWSYKEVLPYFKKMETFNIPKRYDPKYHGYDGPLSNEHPPFRTVPARAWIQSSQEAGHPYVDYNTKEEIGVSFLQVTMTNGTRHSANRAFLYPVSRRSNLHVAKGSLVTKVLFDEFDDKVIGVEFERQGLKYRVFVSREVILSAGALNSPQILMLSGIGPGRHLSSLGIPVKQDLPVGYNLADHVTAPIHFTVNRHSTEMSDKLFVENLNSVLYSYVRYHEGPLSIAETEAILYASSTDNSSTAWPDIELTYAATTLNAFGVFRKIFPFKDDLYEEVYGPLGDTPGFISLPVVIRPKSRGRVLLRDRNPRSKPIFDANYFDNDEDLDIIIKGIKLSIDICYQKTLQLQSCKLYDVPMKKCLIDGAFGSDEYWKCFIRAFTITFWHFSGTCKMGPEDDRSAVLDSRLRVYGVDGLRVVDASIFPEQSTAHISVPVMMVAERAADFIKEDWGLPVDTIEKYSFR